MYRTFSASVFFAILFCCITYTSSAQQNDSLLAQLSRKWINAKEYALKMAELMPEEFYDFKPVPVEMSFRGQLMHIAQNIRWLTSSFLFVPAGTPVVDSTVKGKADVIKILSDAYDMGSAAHKNISAKQLDEVVPFFAGLMTRRQMLILKHDHQTHHVGQIIVYLRLKGITPPDYVGW